MNKIAWQASVENLGYFELVDVCDFLMQGNSYVNMYPKIYYRSFSFTQSYKQRDN